MKSREKVDNRLRRKMLRHVEIANWVIFGRQTPEFGIEIFRSAGYEKT